MYAYKTTTLERIQVEQPLHGAPLIFDDWSLAFLLRTRGKTLWYYIKQRDSLYTTFTVKKASKGRRLIHNPSRLTRFMLNRVRRTILSPLTRTLGPHVTAYRLARSTRDAARQHLAPCPTCAQHEQDHTCTFDASHTGVRKAAGSVCLACTPIPQHTCPRAGVKIHMDLKDFFGSTRRAWVRRYFNEAVGYNHYVSSLLAHILTVTIEGRQGVPQGAPTSGDICNLVADWRLDQPILKALHGSGWVYTRYADDMYFSHNENLSREIVDALITQVTALCRDAGYRPNTRKQHVQRPHKQQRLLGIVVNKKLNIPRTEYRRLKAILTNCLHHGFESQYARAKKESAEELHGWLAGKIAYYSTIEPGKAQRLRLLYGEAQRKHDTTNTTQAESAA